MMTFDNYNRTSKDNNGVVESDTTTATSRPLNQDLSHHHGNGNFYPQGQNFLQHQQSTQQQYYDSQQGLNLPLFQSTGGRGISPTRSFNQINATTTNTGGATPMWNLPFNPHQSTTTTPAGTGTGTSSSSSYYQPTSSTIGVSNRRNSSIDSTNIWSTATNPNSNTSASSGNIWSVSTNLQPNQQQGQMNFPPSLENYVSTSSIVHNRSSSIPGFTSTPPPQQQQQQQQQQHAQISLKESFSTTTPTEISPNSLMDPLIRRRSYTDAVSSGGLTPTSSTIPSVSSATTAGSANVNTNINTNTNTNNVTTTGVISDKNTLQMVNEYFESDPHERVKVTLQLLNERFFDEEKFLGDAYQLPKFPIENSLRNYQLILVGFKAGRIDVFYLPTNNPTNPELLNLKVGDLVIVEADRGRDLGKVFKMNISIDEARLLKLLQFQEQQAALNEHVDNILDDISVKSLSDQQQQQQHHQQQQQQQQQQSSTGGGSSSASSSTTTTTNTTTTGTTAPPTLHFPKSVIALAQPNEIIQILNKKQDEEKACRLCLAKIANATSGSLLGGPTSSATQDLLQMKLIDAEYQFDRKKLIFYYSTSRRIDFRDLVRELFRIYKTRIWMCAVIGLPYQVSSRRNSNSPLSNGVLSQQQQQQQQQQQTSGTGPNMLSASSSIATTNTSLNNSQYNNINRLDRRLSYQIPPTYQQGQQQQQQGQVFNYPQHQHGQGQQNPISYQQDFIPRRFSDSRSQISSWQNQQQQQQQQQVQPIGHPQHQQFVISSMYQFPPTQQHQHQQQPQQQHQQQHQGSMLQQYSEQNSPCTDENEVKEEDVMMIKERGDNDDIEVDEETFSNHSDESFVLKSLVYSINH